MLNSKNPSWFAGYLRCYKTFNIIVQLCFGTFVIPIFIRLTFPFCIGILLSINFITIFEPFFSLGFSTLTKITTIIEERKATRNEISG